MISPTSEQYRHKLEGAKARTRQLVRVGQDIAPIPAPQNLTRRARADKDFRYFCETYFAKLFSLEWSEDHLTIISKIERVVLKNETFAIAMPRGSGKTTLCRVAVIWAVLTGSHQYVYLISATADYAHRALANIKTELQTNDLLLADYPEAVYPIRQLEGESRRCSGQRYHGERTFIEWNADRIVMASIPGSRCASAVISVAGLTGNIRGAQYVRPDGTGVRPTLVIIDDPQTDQSARSPMQTRDRLATINGSILNLAGPGKRVAALLPCTVIEENDLADQLLDRKRNPLWQGERTKFVYEWPKEDTLWEEYARIYTESFQSGRGLADANAFYEANRARMDDGARVAWQARHNPDELSALQHAYNLRIRDESAFFAEYQNEPISATDEESITRLDPQALLERVNGYKANEIPPETSKLTAFVDVQKNCLYYVVTAWSQEFQGFVVDYGTFPEQRQAYFAYRNIRKTLGRAFPSMGLEGRIYNGISQLAAYLFGENWDGYKLDLCLVDANWGESTDVVYNACRQLPYRIYPSHGKWVGATSKPLDQYQGKAATGLNWRIPPAKSKRDTRYVVYDTNFWKNFIAERFITAVGDSGSLTLHKAKDHRLFADHMCSEYRTRVEARDRVVYEWKLRPERPDNHWWDCMVGSAVAASICGVAVPQLSRGAQKNKPAKSRRSAKRVSYL